MTTMPHAMALSAPMYPTKRNVFDRSLRTNLTGRIRFGTIFEMLDLFQRILVYWNIVTQDVNHFVAQVGDLSGASGLTKICPVEFP